MRAPRGTHRDAAGESEVAPRGIPAPPCGRRCAANPPRRKAVGTPQGTPKRRTPFSAFFSSKWRNVRAGVRCSDRMYEQTQGDLERLGQRLLEPERLVPRDMTGFAWHRSWAISRPALADSGPELVWDQHRSVRSAGARPRRPVWRLATNPNVPPEVGAALPHWLAAMLHGDCVFSFVSRVNERRLPGCVHRSIMWAKLKCLAVGAVNCLEAALALTSASAEWQLSARFARCGALRRSSPF